MSIYSIKDLEHLSGIKAHTIRIWEQRYGLFTPQRTETNIRFYGEEDLKLILNISTLRNHNWKISKIVELSPEEICEEVKTLTLQNDIHADQIHALTKAMIDMDEPFFLDTLNRNTEKYGFDKTMMDIIYPFMNKIGILWLTNAINPAQEHFITHLVRQKLISITDQLEPNRGRPLFLLFLPEDELHELGILLANYLLRHEGIRTIYFGQSVPLNAIEEVYHKLNPDYVLTSLTTAPEPPDVQKYVSQMCDKFKSTQVLITGRRVVGQDIQVKQNGQILTSFGDLKDIMSHLNVEQFSE